MVVEGEPAPDFTATDCDGASFRLSSVTPGRPVVLYFYPKSYVPVGTWWPAREDSTEAGGRA